MLSARFLWLGMIGVALAVGLGVQVGQSTIRAIDPVHFQGAAARPRAIDPNRLPAPAQSAYASAYGWEEGDAARQADSAAATASTEDFDYLPEAMVRPAAEPLWREESAPPELAPWPPGQVSPHPEIERYTSYPIEEKPDAPPAPERTAPQPEAGPPALAPADK